MSFDRGFQADDIEAVDTAIAELKMGKPLTWFDGDWYDQNGLSTLISIRTSLLLRFKSDTHPRTGPVASPDTGTPGEEDDEDEDDDDIDAPTKPIPTSLPIPLYPLYEEAKSMNRRTITLKRVASSQTSRAQPSGTAATPLPLQTDEERSTELLCQAMRKLNEDDASIPWLPRR